ncbi:iron ABC transporter permease, partial [Pseudoxanthomonas sp. SGD-10]
MNILQSSSISISYRKLFIKRILLLAGLLLLLFILFCIDLAVGPSMLSVTDVLKAIFNPSSVDLTTSVIIWEVRLPYAIMALLVGGALSLAGCEMQTIMNNPMASPFTLGISAAAAFGAALAIILGVSIPLIADNWGIAANAFCFAFGSALLLQSLSRLRNNKAEVLVLFGIALVFTFNALVGLLQYM